MSDITWNDLPADEQELMRGALPDGYSPDTNIEIARCASLARKGLVVETWGEYTLTDAGRALLTAGEAVGEAEAPAPHAAYKEYLVAREKAWDLGAAFIDYGTWLEQRLAGRETDLAAALARAEKAEGEAKELRTVFYVVYDALNQVNQHFRIVEKAYPQAIAFEDMVIALEQTKDFWKRIEPEFKTPSED